MSAAQESSFENFKIEFVVAMDSIWEFFPNSALMKIQNDHWNIRQNN